MELDILLVTACARPNPPAAVKGALVPVGETPVVVRGPGFIIATPSGPCLYTLARERRF